MQLSAQSIRELCVAELSLTKYQNDQVPWLHWHRDKDGRPRPMIHPFLPERTVINGMSAGLSAASYDIRIAHDLTLPPTPAVAALKALMGRGSLSLIAFEDVHRALEAILDKPAFVLAHSLEDFALPDDVAGYVCDKSSYARRGISAFNTLFDPGFRGNATLELVNLSDREVFIKAGDPICQLVFHRLDRATDRPYQGKYQDQPKQAVGAIHEDGGPSKRLQSPDT